MESMQHQVLEVQIPTEDFDPNFIPETGEQYLQQVVYERRKCPSVVVKPFKRKRLNQSSTWKKYFDEDITDTSLITLRPTKEWRRIQIDEFAHLRAKVIMMKKEFTDKYSENAPEIPSLDDQDCWLGFCKENEPLLRIILQFSQMQLEIFLEYLMEWLNDDEYTNLNDTGKWLGQWIYASLACLQLPLEPNAHSILRQIARACIQRRNKLLDSEMDQSTSLNLLICIISYNFNQKDLSGKFISPNY